MRRLEPLRPLNLKRGLMPMIAAFIRFSIKFHNAGTVSGTESALLDHLTLVI